MRREKSAALVRKVLTYDGLVYDQLKDRVNGGKILSIGCGEGRVERMLHERKGADITGAEVTAYKQPHIPIKLYDGKRLPFKDKSFDASLFVYVLHHSTDMASLLKEAKRVTRKHVLILDHTYTNRVSEFMLKAYDYASNIFFDMPLPFNFLRMGEWETLFREQCLAIEEAEVISALNVFFKVRV